MPMPFNMELLDIIARALVLLIAMPVHEYSHAWMAVRLGDDTPIRHGRLTLNPMAHLSLMGSVALMAFGFGWAKPVTVDMRNFKHPKRDMAVVAIMGPLANALAAFAVLVFYRVLNGVYGYPQSENTQHMIYMILLYMVVINLRLMAFNLLPIPPLDGSKVLSALLPDRYYRVLMRYEGVVIVALLLCLYMGWLMIPIGYIESAAFSFLVWITSPIDILFGLG
ncbi:MAG: site-2 protease family protein [Oscillospiraceae bacterium]|nr:site-2 protease family protein [Oscillospiraceae bacterium]